MIEPNWEEQMWQSMFSTRQAEQNAKALQPELQRLGLNENGARNVANLIAKYIENGSLNPTEVNYLNRNADVRDAFNAIVGENDITGFQWEADAGTTDGGLQQQFGQDATKFDNAQAVITDPATGEVMDSGLDEQNTPNNLEIDNFDKDRYNINKVSREQIQPNRIYEEFQGIKSWDEIKIILNKEGLDQEKVNEILNTSKGNRPDLPLI